MDNLKNIFEESDSLTTKYEPIFEDGICMHLNDYKVSMSDIITEEIDIKWDENINDDGIMNENSKFPKQNVMISKNDTLGDLPQKPQQGQFITIPQSNFMALSTVCPQSYKILTSTETPESYLQADEDHNYACDKRSYDARDESGWNCHKTEPIAIQCRKCSLVFQNANDFFSHYHQLCGAKTSTYSYEKCNQISNLQSVRLEKKTPLPKKVEDSTNQNTVVVSAKALYSKHFNNVTENDDFASFSPLIVQSNSVEQNTIVNCLSSQGRDDIAANMAVDPLSSKDHNEDSYENDEIIAETVKSNHHEKRKKIEKVTRICGECRVSTDFDTDNECNACERKCVFRCNQCSMYFENYQRVSQHLWAQCNLKECYQCFKCDYRSKHKFVMRSHCIEHHPEMVDPLGSLNNAEYVKFKDNANDSQKNHLLPKNLSVPKFIVQHCLKCKKDIELDSYTPGENGSCKNCNSTVYFKCKRCSKFCKDYWHACQHSREGLCYRKVSLRCTKCDYANDYIYELTKHYNEVHYKYSATCKNCRKKFASPRNYKRHMLHCVKPLSFSCEDCSFRTKTKIGLRNHILTTHMNLPSNDVGVVLKSFTDRINGLRGCLRGYCANCDKHSSVDLRVKKCQKCGESLHFACRICDEIFEGNDAKTCEHVKTYFTLLNFECPCCGKGFCNKNRLDLHMISCGKTAYKCRFCTRVFSWKVELRRHEQAMHWKYYNAAKKLGKSDPHKRKIYQCNVCSREYVDKIDNLKKHILNCHVKAEDLSKLPPCARCGWDFKCWLGLKKHLALCGKKLYMECRVTLTRLQVEQPVGLSEDLPATMPPTIKEESVDLNEFEMKYET